MPINPNVRTEAQLRAALAAAQRQVDDIVGLEDGDYGDVTVSGTGTVMTIDADAVTYDKMQDTSVTDVLLGRQTASGGTVEEIPCTAAGRALLDDASAAAQRTTLGLGTLATQDANAVSITGGSVVGITDLALVDGGTGASTAANARTNLGLVIGTDVQAQDAELQAVAGLISAADKLPYFTGSGTASLADFTAAGRAIVDDASAAAQRTTLGLGTIATQDSDAVSITGGSITGLSALGVVGIVEISRAEGTSNLSIGVGAMGALTTGTYNVAIGDQSGGGIVGGTGNVFIGFQAGRDTTGNFNVAVGQYAMQQGTSGAGNFALGRLALQENETGSNNVVIGNQACRFGTAISSDVAIGDQALLNCTGSNNTGVGYATGRKITSGTNNTLIGNGAGDSASQLASAVNSTAIGNNSYTTASNQVVIGNSSVTGTVLRGSVHVARLTNACSLDVYNTSASDIPGTSYERLHIGWDTNVAEVGTQKGAGGGTARDLALITDGTVRTQIGYGGVVASGSCFQPSNFLETYAAGTAYTLTAAPAALNFGTTDPVIVLDQPGTYRVTGWAVLEDVGATDASTRTVTLTLRRTNNTAANLTNGTATVTTSVVSTFTQTHAVVTWEASLYTTANSDDSLTIYGDISATPSAGSRQISQSFIKAERIS